MQLTSFPTSLSSPLSQALNDLDGAQDGEFWTRLAAHLQGLESLAGALPEDLDAEALAAWLASALGGEELPQAGGELPVQSLHGEVRATDIPASLNAGRDGLSLRELLAASLPMLMVGNERHGQPGSALGTVLELAVAGSQREPVLPQAATVLSAPVSDPGHLAREAGNVLPRLSQLEVPLNQPGWDRALGDRIQWMANQNIQVAEIRLNPPNLGPLEVRLQMDGDRTHINFLAPQAAVREAIDAALPRLRELFAEGGLNLGDVTVSHRDARQGGEGGREDGKDAATGDSSGTDSEPGVAAEGRLQGQGLVDYYA